MIRGSASILQRTATTAAYYQCRTTAAASRLTTTNLRYLSSSSSNNSNDSSYWDKVSPVSWWRNRQQAKEEDRYLAKIQEMARAETWTIGHMADEIKESVSTWQTKVPLINQAKEVKAAQQMHTMMQGLVSVAGHNADLEKLESLSRTEKVKAALAGETTVEDVNILIQQYQTMALMHRIIRHRYVNQLHIPETSQGVQALLQSEGPKFLSKNQRQRMMNRTKSTLRRR